MCHDKYVITTSFKDEVCNCDWHICFNPEFVSQDKLGVKHGDEKSIQQTKCKSCEEKMFSECVMID